MPLFPLPASGLLAAWLLVVPAAAAPPAATPSGPSEAARERVLRLLARSEALPREADWAPLGPETLGVLLSVIQDPAAPEPQRLHAIAALAVVQPPEEPTRRLEELLGSPQLPPALRAGAVLALQRRSGLAALPQLLPLLEDREVLVRSTTARALGRMGGADARHALEARLALEPHPEVRAALQQGLSDTEP
jgi:HEAT repeat protein